MARISPTFLCVVALLFAVLTACKAHAETTFGCQFVWNEASADNSISHCLARPTIGTQWKLLIMPTLAAIFLLCVVLSLIVFICCRVTCGSLDESRPKTKEGRERAGCWLYMWIMCFIIFNVGVLFLILFGANKLRSSLQDVLDAMDKNSVHNVVETRDLISNYSQQTKLNISTTLFNTLIGDIQDHIQTMRGSIPEIFTSAQIIADLAGIMGVLLMLLVLAVACCKCTGMGLGAFTVIYVVFSIIYALLAVAFTIFMYFVIAGCGEITQQYHRAPGIGQWYYVPWCNQKYNFKGMLDQLQTEYSTIMSEACTTVLNQCNNVNDFSQDNTKMYFCTFTSQDECITASKTRDIYDSDVYIKPILANQFVTNTSGWDVMPNVTVSECATRCSDFGPYKAKTVSQQLKQSVIQTSNISTAISYMRPMVDCNYVIDNFLISTQTKGSTGGGWRTEGMTSGCANMTTASILLGVGFLVGAVMFLIGFYVLQKGSFIWIRKTEYDAPSSSSDSDFE